LNIEGKFYYRGEVIDGAIKIEDGRIKEIKKSLPNSQKIKGLILPGAIDIHVHFRDPGFTHKEDFYTGTLSAAMGGVTFIMDMPNTYPPVGDLYTFQEKLRIVSQKANVDFSLYFLLNEKAEEFKAHNPAFKLYMGETTAALPGKIQSLDAFISVHAELDECIRKESKDLQDHDMARPESCEVQAIKKLLQRGKFHIAHISSIDAVDICKIGRFTCEVTPHHLFLHKDMPLGSFGKVNPPLRAKWMTEKLWENLLTGRIDIVASDHAPHTIEEKEDDFAYAPSGIPEVETYVPIFIYLMKAEKISLKRMTEVLMERPGEIVGIKKGKIEIGYDGDLIAFTLSDVKKIRSRDVHYKCGWTPYEGFNAIFPHTVLLRGEFVIENYEFVGEKMGRFIKVRGKF